MNGVLKSLISKTIPVVITLLFGGITLSTSVAAGSKLVKVLGKTDDARIPEVKTASNIQANSTVTTTQSPEQVSSTSSTSSRTTSLNSPRSVLAVVTSSSSSSSQQSTNQGCIVTLFGKQYDVTSLRSTHSGGDIFSCGTDMTTTYQNKHGTNMSRMQAYLVTSNGSTSSVGQTNSSLGSNSSRISSSSSRKREDDDIEENHQDREESHQDEIEDR